LSKHDGTLIILNPYAGGGRAGRLWREIEPLLWEELGELVIAVTENPADVAEHLDKARAAGLTRVVAIGGDGTNHAIVNAIQALHAADPQAPPMTFAQLPIGTGQDFARTIGIPTNPREAVRWIADAAPRAIDLGYLEYHHGGTQQRHFLNIGSVGIGGDVDKRVNHGRRYPWSFKLASVMAFLSYQPHRLKVWLDDALWYEGKSWIVAMANGRIFGHGMQIAPHAEIDDGLFDVILVAAASRLETIRAFNTVYSGKHLQHPAVMHQRARSVTIESQDGILDLDLDGEYARGEELHFQVQPAALQLLDFQGG
jgi:diacylglycerol kinase (ATP)